MSRGYTLLVANQVSEQIASLSPDTRRRFFRLPRQLEADPFRRGEFQQPDDVGRPLEGVILREIAVFFRTDHADREIKVLHLRAADA